jgi:hypothetical protein
MTYAQLIEALGTIPFDRLNDTVTVYDPDRGDFSGVNHSEVATEKDNDVLDKGHFYLVLNSYGY